MVDIYERMQGQCCEMMMPHMGLVFELLPNVLVRVEGLFEARTDFVGVKSSSMLVWLMLGTRHRLLVDTVC